MEQTAILYWKPNSNRFSRSQDYRAQMYKRQTNKISKNHCSEFYYVHKDPLFYADVPSDATDLCPIVSFFIYLLCTDNNQIWFYYMFWLMEVVIPCWLDLSFNIVLRVVCSCSWEVPAASCMVWRELSTSWKSSEWGWALRYALVDLKHDSSSSGDRDTKTETRSWITWKNYILGYLIQIYSHTWCKNFVPLFAKIARTDGGEWNFAHL